MRYPFLGNLAVSAEVREHADKWKYGNYFGEEAAFMFSLSVLNMAPIGQDSDPKDGKITKIADLDSASTFCRAEYVRSRSYNNTLVYREAVSKASFIKENDDLFSSQTPKTHKKLNPENVWEDGMVTF